MSNVVESIVNTEFFEIPIKSNNAQEQEEKDYTEFLKIEYTKYRQYKIIYEGIEECVEDDDNLDEDLRNKIKNVLLEASAFQIQTRLTNNPNDGRSETVLGPALRNTDISYSESNKLLSCLKSKLDNKSLRIKNDCLLLGKDISEICSKSSSESPFDLSQEGAILLEFRAKLDLEQECYLKQQIELLELLEELKNIRLKTVPEVTDQKIQECSLRSKINYLKSKIAKDKCRLDIFMETSSSLKAYTEIIKDMKQQQGELKLEIEQLQDLKRKYSQVSCKEYDDILKSYVQYKSSLEKKKKIYELYG